MAAGTRDLTSLPQSGSYTTRDIETGGFKTFAKIFSASDIIAVKGAAIEANEVVQLVDVAAGDVVKNVMLFVITQGTNTSGNTGFEVGTGDDTDGFIVTTASVEDLTAGSAIGTPGAFVYSQLGTGPYTLTLDCRGKLFTAADTIDLKITTSDLLTGKFVLVYDKLTLGHII